MSEAETGKQARKQPQNPPPAEYRWQPGQSGNPSGRPKGSVSVKATARKLAMQGDRDRVKEIVANLFEIAADVSNPAAAVAAIKEIKEWFDGKEVTPIVNINGTEALQVLFELLAERGEDIDELGNSLRERLAQTRNVVEFEHEYHSEEARY